MRYLLALFAAVLVLVQFGAAPVRAETEPPFIPQPPNPAYVITPNTPTEHDALVYPAIVGGDETAPGEWPWQVFVLVHHPELSLTSYVFCGGSLISESWVLTAAHCLTTREPGSSDYVAADAVTVRAGEHNIYLADGTEQVITAAEVIAHPDYNPYTSDSDLALLHLSQPVELNEYAGLVPMLASPAEDALAAPTTMAMTTGWGATGTNDDPSPVLREVDVPIITNETCDFIFANDITSNMVCAGYGPEGPEKDSCFGDSGGPLVVPDGAGGWRLIGITSFGPQECASAYGVYTRVSAFTDWIYNTVGSSVIESFSPASGPAGTQVTITGSGFTGAQQVAFGGVSAQFTVNSDTSISAIVPQGATTGRISISQPLFTIESTTSYTMAYPLTVAMSGGGDGGVQISSDSTVCAMGDECTNDYIDGTEVELHALNGANPDFVFAGWLGDCSSPNEFCTVTVDSSKTVTVVFASSMPKLTVTTASVDGGSGRVESSPGGIGAASVSEAEFALGSTVMLNAIADEGSSFLHWNGACEGQDAVCSLQMMEPSTVEAVFGPSTYAITVEIGGQGSGSVTSFPAGIDCGSNCSFSFDSGATVNLTAAADSISIFTGWDGACSGTNTTCVVTADAAKTAIAKFESKLIYLPGLQSQVAASQ